MLPHLWRQPSGKFRCQLCSTLSLSLHFQIDNALFTEVSLRIVVSFRMSFVTSLRFFAPSLLGTSSLGADVAASVGDNFFCVNLKKFVVSALTGCFSGPCDLRSKRVPAHDVLHPRHPWPGMQLLAAHSKNELSISYLFQEELSPLFSPPLQEKENGTLMPKMSVPLASDSSSVQGWV